MNEAFAKDLLVLMEAGNYALAEQIKIRRDRNGSPCLLCGPHFETRSGGHPRRDCTRRIISAGGTFKAIAN